ncbi:hypothetical protein AX15_007418 [Amanita polypyramis BW_CC]|nr:hypothetical protein AX15_007418 [Amanita polypyramis BW_CC]
MDMFNTAMTAPPKETPSSGDQDVEVSQPPTDSISSLAFSSQADFLAVGSWDNSVRVYEVAANGQTQGRAIYQHGGPVLSVCWDKEGRKVFSGGADGTGRMLDPATGRVTQVAQHDAPVKTVRWIDAPQASVLVTGSWDKTVKYWDLRSSTPVVTVDLPERCYSLDVQYPLMVVGMAGRLIQIFNLNNPGTAFKTIQSPLKMQTRVVSCFSASDKSGFALGGVEGRVAIHYTEEKDSVNSYTFRCHRRDAVPNVKDHSLVYAVNDISFNPVHGTLSTCGSDGTIYFWDKDSRNRLKSFDCAPGPIPTSTFNRNGTIFAYAISYDWYKGHTGMTPNMPNKLMLHACKDEEVRKKPRKT